MATLFIDPELPKHPSLPAEEAVDALERLVAAGMRFAPCLRSHPLLPLDVCLPGGLLHPQGSPGRYQHRARPGPAVRLLRSPARPLPQPRCGPAPAHPRLVCAGLPRPSRHPARQWQTRPGRGRSQGRQGRTQDACRQETPSGIRLQYQAGIHLRPLLPSHRRAHTSRLQHPGTALGRPHPGRRGLLQPRPPFPAGQNGPAARLAGLAAILLLRGRRLLCRRQAGARTAG